jgi:hypothetical protein
MKHLLCYIFKKLHVLNFQSLSTCLTLIFLNQTVIVQWLPNSEPDLAGYKVYYGKASRSYSNIIPVGLSTECTIPNLEPGYEYFFAVTAYDIAGNESEYSKEVSIFIAEDDENLIIPDHKNAYNFPNPFNPEIQITQIRYHLSKSEEVTITIFDVAGNKVRTLLKNVLKNPGEHIEDSWDGKDENGNLVPNGIYYARVSSKSLDHYITIAITK